jgi:hypothetical protein
MWSVDNFHKTPWGVHDVRESRKNGDWSINTWKYIVETEDRTRWAKKAFMCCHIALCDGRRWPDAPYAAEMITQDAKKQTKLTRDCFIYHHACAIYLHPDLEFLVSDVKVPWTLYRPEFHAWRRALLGKRNCYKFWRKVTPIWPWTHWYVTELQRYMDDTYNLITNKTWKT